MPQRTEQIARPYQESLARIETNLVALQEDGSLTEDEQYIKATAIMASANRILINLHDAQVMRERLSKENTGDFTSPKIEGQKK